MDLLKILAIVLIVVIIISWFTKKDEHLTCTKNKDYKTPDSKDKEPCEDDCDCNKKKKCLTDANNVKKCV
jgi:hypothetical protein